MPDKSPIAPAESQLIIKFRDTPQKHDEARIGAASRLGALSLQSGIGMHIARPLSGGAQLVTVRDPVAHGGPAAIAERLSARPDIEYAEPDIRVYPALTPNDPRFSDQYYLRNSSIEPSAINAPTAWNITTGSAGTVVAVIDTGIRPEHIDIAGRLVPGYDFVSANTNGSFFTANDGNGRDSNPADPGDGVAAGACGENSPPLRLNSSWHGTRVASLIGAVTNNGQGIAGVGWSARILPVRALGRCGGRLSDVIDASRWAAGLPVPGVLNNPNPANVINMSLGALGTCSPAMQAMVTDVVKAGALVVTAAGNASVNALRSTPSGCRGVLPVAALTRSATLRLASNFGVKVGLSAPGTNILTATNRGPQAPAPGGDTYSPVSGTSLAAPLAAGAAGLMLSLNPDLKPQQLISTMRAAARAFPPSAGVRCKDPVCGAGVLDAAATVQAVAAGKIAANDGGNGLRAAFKSASPVALGETVAGSLNAPFKFDVYRITLSSGGNLRVTTTGDTDTYGYLFDAGGKLLAQNDDIDTPSGPNDPQFNLNFRINANLAAGTYFAAVEGFARTTRGNYRLATSGPSQASSGGGGGGAAPELLGVVVLALLGGLVIQRRVARTLPRQDAANMSPAKATPPPKAP
jgi:serine protease